MSVSIEEYDQMAPAMLDGAVSPLSYELFKHGLMIVPIALLTDAAAWVMDVPAVELRAIQADWRFLTPADPDEARPALVRLDLLLPERRPLPIVWQATSGADLDALSYACLADRIGFKHWTKAGTGSPGLVIRHIGLRDLPGFREVAGRVRAMLVIEALYG